MGPVKATTDDHDSHDHTSVTQTECRSLVIGPVDRRNGLSREIEQASTHNKPEEYAASPTRVKMTPRTTPLPKDIPPGNHPPNHRRRPDPTGLLVDPGGPRYVRGRVDGRGEGVPL
ncbi:hypothetical protein GCM10010249_06430 [Streptomyces roseolilacinus]|uniref:Uncharacterized protein n=1 Tax=Streptomyces roseolilacinus TaxID=66904 RepID=A0A918AZ96_9ACTN|nr:hypothetical protein GCM10010249_06430 [Streptomyces roseolilacinus]